MKRGFTNILLFAFGFLVIISLASSAPIVTINSPTPENDSVTPNNWMYINFTIENNTNGSTFVDFNNSLHFWLRFNNESSENSTLSKDWSSWGNNCTISGATINLTGGVLGGGLVFDGVNDYVVGGNPSNLNMGTDNFTIAGWIKINNRTGSRAFGRHGGGFATSNPGWTIYFNNGTPYLQFGSDLEVYKSGALAGATKLNESQWYYIAGVFNRNENFTWYLNGIKNGNSISISNSSGANVSSPFSNLYLGSVTSSLYLINGSMDEIVFFKRALSDSEILSLYNNSIYVKNFTNLNDGNYNFTVYSQNLSGNITSALRKNLEVWNLPRINLFSPLEEEVRVIGDISINITVSNYYGNSMNVTFLESLNETICHEDNVLNGSEVICNYPGLSNSEYRWGVNVSDGSKVSFLSYNFSIGVIPYQFSENYDNKKMSFIFTGDDWDSSSDWHNGFMNYSDKAQELGIWFSPGFITKGLYEIGSPRWEIIQSQFNEGYISAASHSRNHYHPDNFTIENATLEANGSKNDIEGNLTLPSYNWFNGSQHMVAWIAPFYEVSSNLTLALSQSNYLIHRGHSIASNGENGWGGFNESLNLYGDSSDVSLSNINEGYTFENYTVLFDAAYNSGEQFHLMTHPGWETENLTEGSIASRVLEYIGNRTDVWYAGMDHTYMYRYMTNQSLPTVNITSNSSSNTILLHANASAEDRNKYALSYPITYEISVPSNWTDVYVYYKNNSGEEYITMENKTRDTVWNGIDVYRKDLDNDKVYISKSFPQYSNDIYLLMSPIDLYPVSVVVSSEDESVEEESGISYGATFRPSKNNLGNGYSIKIKEDQKVEILIGDSGDKKEVVVESVNEEEIVVSVDGKDYTVSNDENAKIDLDSDGYYDVEISVNGDTVNGYANLKFVLINEEVPSEVEEEKNENILDEIPDVIKKIDWKVYALIGVVVLVVIFIMINKKVSKKKRYMMFGY